MKTHIAFALAAGMIAAPAFAIDPPKPVASAGAPAVADTAVAAPAAATAAVPAAAENVLRSGMQLSLRMREGLTTKGKDLKAGYRFHMELAEAVVVNGLTVFPAGTPATGEVRYKGGWGKSGKINARPLYLSVSGRNIRLSGQIYDKGKVGTAAVVGTTLLSPLLVAPLVGFLVTGTSAEFPIGMPITAFLDEDVHFEPASPAPRNVADSPGDVAPASTAATPAT